MEAWRYHLALILVVLHPMQPLTPGPYARVRHPRYVQHFFGIPGLAFLANYLAAYIAVAL